MTKALWWLKALLVLLFSLLALSLHASTERRKDLVFVGPAPHCIGDAVECAESVHFNGVWAGTQLCRAGKCVKFEDIKFTEVWDARKRH